MALKREHVAKRHAPIHMETNQHVPTTARTELNHLDLIFRAVVQHQAIEAEERAATLTVNQMLADSRSVMSTSIQRPQPL